MKSTLTALVLAGTVAAIAASPASAAATKVHITSWHVYTSGSQLHKVKPGATFKTCASKPVEEIDAKGKVSGATAGTQFDEIWKLDGKTQQVFHATWDKSGSFVDYFGLSTSEAGTWSVKLKQAGGSIGGSNVKLKTKKGC